MLRNLAASAQQNGPFYAAETKIFQRSRADFCHASICWAEITVETMPQTPNPKVNAQTTSCRAIALPASHDADMMAGKLLQ